MIAVEIAIIIAYMTNSILGMGFMLAFLLWKLIFGRKDDSFYRSFELLIMALPLAYIGIAGPNMHQVLSWYNLFLLAFIIKIIVHFSAKISSTALSMLSLLIIVICLFLNLFWTKELSKSVVEITQILIRVY